MFFTVIIVGFFGSFRMSELLSNSNKHFDKFSTLLWEDVKFYRDKIKVIVKSPKTSKNTNEIYLFKFKNKDLCPVRNFGKLKKMQKNKNLYNREIPVFRFESGQLMSKSCFNKFLKEKTSFNISGHVFRNAIPTILANHPKLFNDQHVMGWGRWNSKAFLTYQKCKFKQKKWVFRKVEKYLLGQN
jgi:hypothetical protein